MSTRLTTGLLSCLMMSILVGCASSPESLIRGQSPSAYPMPAGAYTGHGFGAYSQEIPFPYDHSIAQAMQAHVRSQVDAYYGTDGSSHNPSYYGAGGVPVSTHYPGALFGGKHAHGAACETGQCQDPSCQECRGGHGFGHCWNKGHAKCPHCKGRGCKHCKGSGYGAASDWAPTHLYQHMYRIPQGMVYPQNPTPGAITVYPYYTHKGPDDFFHPPLNNR